VAGLGVRLLLGHGVHQDSVHVAAGSELVEPVKRQHRPLPAALAGLDDLDGHILVALGQLAELLGQDINGDWPLVLGMLMHDQLGELLFTRLSTR
jgi:hypothetical protein